MALKRIFGWVGDSITEGYGDGATVSCNGVPGRLLRTTITNFDPVQELHLNMGASGMLVPEYIDIAKGIISADPKIYTAIFCSVWSPNLENTQVDVPGIWPTRPENLATMRSALRAFEQWLLDRSIVFMPTFMAGSPFGMKDTLCALLQAYVDSCTVEWPWLLNLNTAIQDPAVTSGPYISAAYRTDATHPNSAGYTAMGDYIRPLIPAAFNAAVTHYGFVEP